MEKRKKETKKINGQKAVRYEGDDFFVVEGK